MIKQRIASLSVLLGMLGVSVVGIDISAQAAQAKQLEVRWNQDEAQGVPVASLTPLRSALANQQGSLANLDPWWTSQRLESLKRQTEKIETGALADSRTRALSAKTELARALGVSDHMHWQAWREALESANTSNDYNSLAAEWHLEALLVPIDRQVADALGSFNVLTVKTRGLGVSDAPAADVNAAIDNYLTMGDALRGRLAGRLLVQVQLASQTLQERYIAAQGAHAALANAAAAIAGASNAGLDVAACQAKLALAQAAYKKALTPAEFSAVSATAQEVINTANAELAASRRSYGSAPSGGGTHIISGVAFYYQSHNLSCEETAISMALTHQGMHVSQDQILAGLGVDNTPAVLSNGYVIRWGNPDKAFVGNVNGSESNYTGQQANPKALVRVLNSYGARIIEWSEPGVGPNVISAQEIYSQVLQGHPVVAYATWDWRWHRIYYYTSEDGNRVPLISPWNDHVYTVVGVSNSSVLVNDPIRGQYWVSKGAFEAAYEFGMAIVLA